MRAIHHLSHMSNLIPGRQQLNLKFSLKFKSLLPDKIASQILYRLFCSSVFKGRRGKIEENILKVLNPGKDRQK